MGKSLGSIKCFRRLRSIHLNPAVGVMSMRGNKWKPVCHNWTFFFPVKRMKTASSDAMGQREDSRIWKILEILKSELVNLFGLYAVLEEREVNTFKGLVFTLPKSFSSSSKPDRAGFKCLLLFPTGHFCLGTRAHTEFQYQWDTTSNAALNWQHSWVVLHVYQLSRSKVCRHWVEQQYATKLTVVLLEKKK